MLNKFLKDLQAVSNKEKAISLRKYFKTGKGEYGEDDVFLGITVPDQRNICKNYTEFSLFDIQKLLDSKVHEHRLCALFVLIHKYNKVSDQESIIKFYLRNTKNINNWDLVDTSAPSILGKWLLDKDRKILSKLARSKSLWEKRISIISTYEFIKNGQFNDTLSIAEILLDDKHDLIHKAVGWMLREVGKKDIKAEEVFLKKHYKNMPRTMLRYAIEKFPIGKKKYYMN
ncbi:MAG: DNA alkylation repair protein [Candidatus Aenigmarchaeota archaeon]|nr:DNA alkylation repair protein [Candidatus Aenigmarchaeota archaeon]